MSHKAASGLVTSGARVVCGIAVAGAISLILQVTPTAQRGAPAASSASSPAKSVEVVERTILDVQAEMTAGRTTAREIAAAHLARITAYDKQGPAINALIALNPPRARGRRRARSRSAAERGPRGPLHGIPLRHQGQLRDGRHADHRRFAGAGRIRGPGATPSRSRSCATRARSSSARPIFTSWPPASSPSARSAARPATRTTSARTPGGSSGGTAAAVAASFARGGNGERHLRVDPHPRRQQQPVRPARHPRVVEPRPASFRCRTRRTSAGRSRARSPIWR